MAVNTFVYYDNKNCLIIYGLSCGAEDAVGDVTFTWDLGDGTTPQTFVVPNGEGGLPSDPPGNHYTRSFLGDYTFPAAGLYTVIVTVTDGEGTTYPSNEYNLFNIVPSFTVVPDPGDPLSYTFTSTTTTEGYDLGQSFHYSWNFGDGNTSNGSEVYNYFPDVGSYDVTLSVTDGWESPNGASITQGVTVGTPAACPTLESPIADGIYTKPYYHEILSFGGWYTDYELLTPLPKGLTFRWYWNEGDPLYKLIIEGIPQVYGYFTFEINATGFSTFCDGPKIIEMIIVGPPIIINTIIVTIPINKPYEDYVHVKNGTPPYTYTISSGLLPDGLFLDKNTGRLFGTPVKLGVFPFDVTVYDVNLLSDTKSYVITVVPPLDAAFDQVFNSHMSDIVVVKDPFHNRYLFNYLPYSLKNDKDE